MTQLRTPKGIPTGGRFAPSSHGDPGTDALSGAYVPLTVLRTETEAAVDRAINAIADNAMVDAARLSDGSFPQSEHARSVHALQTLRSELTGAPRPEPLSEIEANYRAYEARLRSDGGFADAGVVGGHDRSITEMRANTTTAVNEAIALLNSGPVNECHAADGTFPSDAYSAANQALQGFHQRLSVQPVRPINLGMYAPRTEAIVAPWPDKPFAGVQSSTGITERLAADDRYAAYRGTSHG